MSSGMDREDLNQVACDYAAGDLSPDEAAAFERVMAESIDLQKEVDFWRAISGELRNHGRPAVQRVPGPGFNEVLRRRLERDRQAPIPSSQAHPGWMPGLTAALAALLFLVIGLGVMWGGGSSQAPGTGAGGSTGVAGASLAGSGEAEFASLSGWAGMSATPVEIDHSDGPPLVGLRVVQVEAGSPAERLGIRPGDVVLALDGEATRCPNAFARRIASYSPGDICRLRVFHPESAVAEEYDLQLGQLDR